MQDTFMSDSEDEGGEVECPIQQQQQYRYMNSEAGTLHRAKPLEDSVTDGHLWPSNNDKKVATIDRQPLDIGFLVSFVVDARGGAMKAKRRGGVRIIVPPAACAAPTRVTCRAATRRAPAAAPPPLMEGEALASRLLELQPQGAKFLAPVIIEVPIFTASCPEREIIVLRSDTGETWQDHYLHNNDNPMIQEALQKERQEHGTTGETLGENGERVTRIITTDFPHYLAVVSRVRQEVHIIGPEGGTVSSAHIPQVQALFPASALTKRIRVGLQAHGAGAALRRRLLPRLAAVSPVVTVEPRRRKFHRSITLTVPLPDTQDGGREKATTNLRLLCSIMGGQARAVWEDVTGSTPLTITDDCASFTTTVSARFWLMSCQNVSDATKLATELYRDMLLVPFEVRIVVLGKRLDALEGRLLVLYITDRYAYDTLLQQEHYTEVAHSTSVRFLDGKEVFLEFSGNLVPVTKSGSQPMFTFEAFKDNRVEFTVRVKHHEESPAGRIYFMNEPKVPRGEQSQTPACVLDVTLPERIAPRAGKSQLDYLNLDQSGFDALKDELSFHWGDHNNSLGPGSLPYHQEKQVNGHDKIITNGDVNYHTKDTDDKDTKPQVNGDTLHVDSNKTKATFDSDEDKTPMNTLEKGKKKPEGEGKDAKKKPESEGKGSFFGGLADKVKNVFSHSEDKDEEEKESSPKPQPKPRESKEKEKSPPKPAPRIINEDLLDKVDDMFKDLKQKPPQKDEDDFQNQLYNTKLVVDEDDVQPLKEIKEEISDQYAHMQPVDTPLYQKVSDPFQYPKCCDKKYKHAHDETSNLEDIVEQTKFAAHERLQNAGEHLQNDLNDGLAIVEDAKHDIKQKANEKKKNIADEIDILKEDVKDKQQAVKSHFEDIQKAQDKLDELNKSSHKTQDEINARILETKYNVNDLNDSLVIVEDTKDDIKQIADEKKKNIADKIDIIKEDLKDKEQAVKSHFGDIQKAHDKLDELNKSSHKTQDEINARILETKNNVADEIGDFKSSTKAGVDHLVHTADGVTTKLTDKVHEINFAAMERAEQLKRLGHDNVVTCGDTVKSTTDDLKTKAKEVGNDLKSKTQDEATNVANSIHNVQDNLSHKADEVTTRIKETTETIKKATNDKIQNLNESIDNAKTKASDVAADLKSKSDETKEELKSEIKKKSKESKNFFTGLVHNIFGEKEKLEDDVKEKIAEGKESANDMLEKATIKKAKIEESVAKKKEEFIEDADLLAQNVESKKDQVEKNIQGKTDEFTTAVKDKALDVKTAVQDKTQTTKAAVQEKANEIKSAVQNKAEQLSEAAHDKKEKVSSAIISTKDNVVTAVNDKASEVKEALSETKDTLQNKTVAIGQSINDKKEEIGHTLTEKKDEWKTAVHDKTEKAISAMQDKKDEITSSIQSKQDEVTDSYEEKKHVAATEIDRIRQEAEHTTDEIKKSSEDTLNAAASKGKKEYDQLHRRASDKASNLQQSSKQAFDHVQDATLSTFDMVESSAKDKVSDAKDTWEDLQSSTRDTYADFRDDVHHGLESSAQDTLRSFQSSAGNTFDSLDDSAKDLFGGVQHTAQNVETSSKDLFNDAKGEFEGFQVSADNKLEEVKGLAKERLDEAGERLGDAAQSADDSIRSAEQTVANTVTTEADKFTSSLNDLGNSVFGSSGKGFMKDSSTKLLESEKSQSSPHKKGSGIPKLKRKK